MKKLYFDLLRTWCDALIDLQFHGYGDPTLDGGFHCRACQIIHGRAADAVYPFMVMAKHTGEERYINAAKAVFDFGESLVCDDGSVLNDGQSTWKGITVFSAAAICEALEIGRNLLDSETVERWEKRLLRMGEWLYENITEKTKTNINYPATNAYTLTCLGKYFGIERYIKRGELLANYVLRHITENGFLYGEGSNRDGKTPLGCVCVDMGYNMEESMPALVKYAFAVEDKSLIKRLADILLLQLDFMLPDGALDNSFGTRNYKWTYWGSRTSDGCACAFTLLASHNPIFAEAARRNTELLMECTHGGLLYGGPHYYKNGQKPCTHHTFEHAVAIAFALENSGDETYERVKLPIDTARSASYYPEINTYKLSAGDYRATITGYDSELKSGGHVTGGTISMLWKYGSGAMMAASTVDYVPIEAHNMQLPRDSSHRTLVMRLVKRVNETEYSTAYFAQPKMTASESGDSVTVKVISGLSDKSFSRMKDDSDRIIEYTLSSNGLNIKMSGASNTELILPVISGEVNVLFGKEIKKEKIFYLTGGFEAMEYTVIPNESGVIEITIK